MTEVVLDASAILANIFGEPGAERTARLIGDAHLSAVNLAEVAHKLLERGYEADTVRDIVEELPCKIDAFDATAALRAGLLWQETRRAGLSLADRACLDLAMALGLDAYTADRAWADLDLGVEVVLIR